MPEGQQSKQTPELAHSQFFALRTPLLPMEELIEWSGTLTAAQAALAGAELQVLEKIWEQDVQRLRDRLRKVLSRPEILHALYIASPSLLTGIEHWKRDPDSKKGLQAERALVRYFSRMATRPTPFGLFSGCSVGLVEEEGRTILTLKPRAEYRLCCRLDFEYLFALTAVLRRDPALEMELRYWPNSSLHKIADAWHYTESRLVETRRTHHLVKVESDCYLEATLKRAQAGATIPELVEAVLQQPGEANPSVEEATEYVLGLIRDNDFLVPNISPLLTGMPPLDDIIQQMEGLPSGKGFARSLRDIRDRIASLDGKGLGSGPEDYEAVAREVEKLQAEFDRGKLFQVDMVKPVEEAVLGKTVMSELASAVKLLCRLGRSVEPEEIKSFREAFSARYEQALVPLAEALDEQAGVGFGRTTGTDGSPLLRGLFLPDRTGKELNRPLSDSHKILLQQVLECARAGKTELELDISGLRADKEDAPGLADTFCVTAALSASSASALQKRDFEIYVHGGVGPSGVRLLGRFCHTDPAIQLHVEKHLRQEEIFDPEAIFAEVVYLPEGRLGNVLCRPVLRGYEIPYLGRSGAPQDRQLPVYDLLVGIENGSIVLYSRKLGRRIIPRLTNAHGFTNPQLSPVYRFLCYLQHQHGVGGPGFSWGPLESLDFLPRVRSGRIVLSLARWRLSQKEIDAIGKPEKSRRFLAVQELRRKRALPRWVVLQEQDNSLPVDLENALSVDAFVHVLKRGVTEAILTELYPLPEHLCVTSPEGHFYHELNVPLVRIAPARASDEPNRESAQKNGAALAIAAVNRGTRIFPPGSDWLYLKLYGGAAILDDVLTTAFLPMVQSARASQSFHRWFFIRYADPHEHLRIRFYGEAARLTQEVLPLALQAFNPLLFSGKLWKIELDTYQREIERYGGLEGMLAAEDIFWADSETVLAILQELQGDEGLDMRWRIGLMSVDRLLTDFILDQNQDEKDKRLVVTRGRDVLQRTFETNAATKQQLSDKFRTERRKLEALLDSSSELTAGWAFARQALDTRSGRIAEPIRRLRSLAAEGKLTTDLADLASSYIHMHINRLIRSAQRPHEFILYDLLTQLYEGRIARKNREDPKNLVSGVGLPGSP